MSKLLKKKIRSRLVSDFSQVFSKENVEPQELRGLIVRVLEEFNTRERLALRQADKERVIDELLDEFTGFGPLEPLLKNPQITEIMINGPDRVYVECAGKTELSNVTFDDEHQMMYLVYKILAPTRRRVDESYPYTDVSLKDGSRVNIIIPPLALNGPTITIRKFLQEMTTIETLISAGTLDRRMADLLIASIRAKINIVFSGATGAGKTTTLNVLSSYIPDDERVVTIEDTAELKLRQDHVVRLESRQPNIEGRGEVTIRDIFRNTLRMRPDRIILGEIRGAEALDMLQAICSGHAGSLSVLHANTPQDVIYRLETMILTSGVPISLEAIHRQIAAALNLIVQQEQMMDGSRKITHISQVRGLNKDGQVIIEDIFFYEIEGISQENKIVGRWRATGVVPAFYNVFKKMGITVPIEIFNKD